VRRSPSSHVIADIGMMAALIHFLNPEKREKEWMFHLQSDVQG